MEYENELSRDIMCIDVKSFYASVECVERGYHPMKTMLVVMSNAENAGGLVLASSPAAKKRLGISNVMRKYDLPNHPDLKIVAPRMQLYIEKNKIINDIYRQYVADSDILIYSIDETFIDVTQSKHLFAESSFKMAKEIQLQVYQSTGLYVTIGLGDNPLLAKLALDNEAKNNKSFIAEWRYADVPSKLWEIDPITEMWGIGARTAKRLARLGIHSVYDLAHYNPYQLKDRLGVIGAQLYAHAHGIDRSQLSDTHEPVEKSYGHSQVLPKDYSVANEIEVVIQEMAAQVSTRLRERNAQTQCVSLYIGYSWTYRKTGMSGFSKQMKVPTTNDSKLLKEYCLTLFRDNWAGADVRMIGITYSKLVYIDAIQLDLFADSEGQLRQQKLDLLVDKIRKKYGYTSIVHANSMMKGATAIKRSSLIGGHAGGMDGL